jgi:AcrR family transcriptional regulator
MEKHTQRVISQERGAQARQQLINAALQVFSEYGINGATTREIAHRAEQNIAAITYYFRSKEGLYLAVAQSIADYIQQMLAPLAQDIDQYWQRPAAEQSASQCLVFIKRGLLALGAIMLEPQTLSLSKIMTREQLSPTAAYPLIHQQVLAPMHQRFCRLIANYTGMTEQGHQVVVHAHALIGEVLSFRIARETILRQANWQQIGAEETKQITDVLVEHIDILMHGLRQRYRGSAPLTSLEKQQDAL